MEKIITYIDGFNLYFGLKSKKWKRYYWLDLQKLSENLLKPNQILSKTKYFTARISSPPGKVKRQGTFIEALMTLKNLEIFYGKYQSNTHECSRCKAIFPTPNEKMTDVNIATELLSDAFQNLYDTALLVSADSDLIAPIKKVLKLFPDKRIICAFPPDRFSIELAKTATEHFTIGRKKLANSIFPDEVTKQDGFILKKPEKWV
jgi:hypothetical protein